MKPEFQFFFTKAIRSLEIANLLRERGDHDFASSRAYYAMFYMAEALLWSLGLTYKSHSQVIGVYGREFAKTGKLDPKFHQWLIAAENWRKKGDYDTRTMMETQDSLQLCVRAKEFIDAAEKYLNDSTA